MEDKLKKSKLLIAGGGYADIPLILAAKKLGFYVITSGNRKEDLGHKYSDEIQLADFSDPEAILKIAIDNRIDAISPCCNDFSALSAAYVAEKLGLPGHDLYQISKLIHHKDQYRKFAIDNSIRTPLAFGFDDIDNALAKVSIMHFPVIIKPVDLTGGKGITVSNNLSEVEKAIEIAFDRSRAKRIVIEEFIEGTRHGFSAFLRAGRIIFYFTDNEYYYLNQYLVSAASSPGNVSAEIEEQLIYDSEKIASKLKLKDGIFHVQFIISNNLPYIIEICRRPPGDLYVKLVDYATGIDFSSYIIKAFAGIDCKELDYSESQGFYTRHCIMCSANGILEDISYDNSIKSNIIEQFLWWKKGDIVTDFLTAKFGIVFLKFQTKEEMLDKTEKMQELIQVKIKK